MFSKLFLLRNLSHHRNLFLFSRQFISFKKTIHKSFPLNLTNYRAFTTNQQPGHIKIIDTVADHKVFFFNYKPPLHEDTIGGRYASTLFIVGSKAKELYRVYEDMKYISGLYEKVESFRIFADNAGLNNHQISECIKEMSKCGEFCDTTLKFCGKISINVDLIGKNKRFMFINDIAKKYLKLYLLLTKEEKITIISASNLSNEDRESVNKALKSNPDNEGKTFIIDFEVNPALTGGLQMYTENKFMDLSLISRIDRIKDELTRLI